MNKAFSDGDGESLVNSGDEDSDEDSDRESNNPGDTKIGDNAETMVSLDNRKNAQNTVV